MRGLWVCRSWRRCQGTSSQCGKHECGYVLMGLARGDRRDDSDVLGYDMVGYGMVGYERIWYGMVGYVIVCRYSML